MHHDVSGLIEAKPGPRRKHRTPEQRAMHVATLSQLFSYPSDGIDQPVDLNPDGSIAQTIASWEARH
jgi:hypothetical protein